MTDNILIKWGSITNLTLTSLASSGSGHIWQSGEINASDPSETILEISYTIVFNSTPTDGDVLRTYIARGNQDSTEIWPAGIGTTVGKVTATAATAEIRAALNAQSYHWRSSHSATFKQVYTYYDAEWSPSWQVLIEPVGESLSASGHTVSYRYGKQQVVAA